VPRKNETAAVKRRSRRKMIDRNRQLMSVVRAWPLVSLRRMIAMRAPFIAPDSPEHISILWQ
jgi:hypothetical protein